MNKIDRFHAMQEPSKSEEDMYAKYNKRKNSPWLKRMWVSLPFSFCPNPIRVKAEKTCQSRAGSAKVNPYQNATTVANSSLPYRVRVYTFLPTYHINDHLLTLLLFVDLHTFFLPSFLPPRILSVASTTRHQVINHSTCSPHQQAAATHSTKS